MMAPSFECDSALDERWLGLGAPQRAVIALLKVVMRQRGDDPRAIELATEIAAQRFQVNRIYVGTLVEYGRALHDGDPRNATTCYVKLHTAAGERTVWGADLGRACQSSQAVIGDEVALACYGQRQQGVEPGSTTVKPQSLEHVATHRAAWDMRKLDTLRAETRTQLAMRTREWQPVVNVYDRDAPRAEQARV